MGLNYCHGFLTESDKPTALSADTSIFMDAKKQTKKISRMEDMVRHIKHIVNIGGIEVCGLGSDFDGINNPVEIGNASGIQQLYEALVKSGFSEDDADKIFYKNVLRVYQDVLK